MFPSTCLLSPLLYFLVVEASPSAGGYPFGPELSVISSVHEIPDSAEIVYPAEIVVHNLYSPPSPPQSLIAPALETFPQARIPSSLVQRPSLRGFLLRSKSKVRNAVTGVVSILLGSPLWDHEAYQQAALLTLGESKLYPVQKLARRIAGLPVEAMLHNDLHNAVFRNHLALEIHHIINDGMTLLNRGDLPFSDRFWLHQMLGWLGDLTPTPNSELQIQKPYEAELSRGELERYILQHTLLQKKSYIFPPHVPEPQDDTETNTIVEGLVRAEVLKELKDKVPQLFAHHASPAFQELFDSLMIVQSAEEPVLEPVARATRENLHKLICDVIDDTNAPRQERVLAYKVLKHFVAYVPQRRAKFDNLIRRDAKFNQAFYDVEAIMTLEKILASPRTSKDTRTLIVPLEKLGKLEMEDFRSVLRGIIAPEWNDDPVCMQLYLAASLASRFKREAEKYFEKELETNRKLLQRVSIVWESLYPDMSLESIPKASYEYKLLNRRPDLLEYAERYLLVRRWNTNNKPDLAALEGRILNLPIGQSHSTGPMLLERFLAILNSGPVKSSGKEVGLPYYDAMRIYELLAQLLKHNWSRAIDSFEKDLRENFHLQDNLETLAEFFLRPESTRGQLFTPLGRAITKELSQWIIERKSE